MAINVEQFEGRDVVLLMPTEELLSATVIEAIQTLTDTYLTKRVILDLRAIRSLVSGSLYPDAEPFSPLLKLQNRLQEGKRELVLCNLRTELAEVFRLIRFDKVLNVQADRATTLADVE
ncbi:hypothetical protein LOC68_10515 [Blastopirellula sp. JC732]|uniref:STAS domain-containing protein n=1 Tax=Blastopirellula sediminis TaxID=2894196 RepID=A0A9X1MM30_9BACT|nr:hypothetical protein [Blastopirellula sediminis]MCC9608391.1 hypothetical protein [Blastopirellula sediminis]MCC9628832.1 hypothetical protein [Blastopirellula sediminis]